MVFVRRAEFLVQARGLALIVNMGRGLKLWFVIRKHRYLRLPYRSRTAHMSAGSAGFLPRWDVIPVYWVWYGYINPLRYAWGALMINGLKGRNVIISGSEVGNRSS